jgi:peptide/nickel transport system ATP-binding protein
LLQIEDLRVQIPTPRGAVHGVAGVNLALHAGGTLGIVGESGSGKTMLSRAVLRLLPAKARVSGRVLFDGRELLCLGPDALRRLRGREIAVVFQDPMTSLNPVLAIGTQIVETLREHFGTARGEALAKAATLLAQVGIPEAERRLRQFPHELSGGMRQRVAIAIALACEPKLLFADEPTSALDVTVQAQILDLLAAERARRQMTLVLITHDLGVVASRTQELAVMYAGRVMEHGSTRAVFRQPLHPYTRSLLGAIPRLDRAPHEPLAAIPGGLPDPTRPLPGCAFAPRCALATADCRAPREALAAPAEAAHRAACWRAEAAAAEAGTSNVIPLRAA